jgi:hypothetical protein
VQRALVVDVGRYMIRRSFFLAALLNFGWRFGRFSFFFFFRKSLPGLVEEGMYLVTGAYVFQLFSARAFRSLGVT